MWVRAGLLTDVEFAELRYAGKPAAFLRGFRALYLGLLVNCVILGWVTKAMTTIVGVVLAKLGLTLLLRQAPANLPRLNEVSLDLTAFAFAVLAAFASSILFGLAPAWQAARLEVGEALKQGGSRGVVGRGSHRLRDAVVVAEIALSLVLAIGAGLLFRSFVSLTTIQLGFRSEGLLVMYAHAPAHSLNDHLRVGRLYEDVLAQVRRIPGVRSAAGAMGLPAGHYGSNGSYAVEGKHYLATMGIPLVQGREFTAQDVYQSPFVAVVSESLVRQVFPRESPLGCRIQLGLDDPEKWVTIVGVAGDVRSSPATPLERVAWSRATHRWPAPSANSCEGCSPKPP